VNGPGAVRRQALARLPRTLLASVGQIYFQPAPLSGAALLLCLYLGGQTLAPTCVLGAAAAIATAYAARWPAADIEEGLYSYNGALAGAALGALFDWSPALPAWIVGAGIVSAALCHGLLRRGAPPLTAPFALLMLAALAFGPTLGLRMLAPPPACGKGLLGYSFCVIGQAGFIDSMPLGALLLAALSHRDWRHGAWAMAGALLAWYVLTLGALWPRAGIAAQATGMGVNCALAVLALHVHGRAPATRLLGGLGAILLSLLLGKLGLPYFTLPFVLATWGALLLSALPEPLARQPDLNGATGAGAARRPPFRSRRNT